MEQVPARQAPTAIKVTITACNGPVEALLVINNDILKQIGSRNLPVFGRATRPCGPENAAKASSHASLQLASLALVSSAVWALEIRAVGEFERRLDPKRNVI
jgi:inosine-uridine nucleoside N-ribohydrolase